MEINLTNRISRNVEKSYRGGMDHVRIMLGAASSTTDKTIAGIKVPGTNSDSGMEEVSCGCQKLTKTQRLYGFATCFCIGYIISFVVYVLF